MMSNEVEKNEMTKIQIAVAYHKNSELIKNDCLLPIQVGKACSDVDLDMQGDDTGDNISSKNFGYAELTAIYWLWKNSKADIKGLFHYRRFLDLNVASEHWAEDIYEYPLSDKFSSSVFLSQLDISEKNIKTLLGKYLILTRRKEDLHSWSNYSVREHYAAEHHGEHFEKALEIIKQDYPEYYASAEKLANGHTSYFTNVFIMKKEEFNEYCSWMFDILFKIEPTLNLYDKTLAPNTKKARWAGFLGERLTAIYIQKQIDDGQKVGEFPAVILTPNNDQKWYECNTYDTNLYVKKQEKKEIVKNKENPKQPIISVCIAAYNVGKYIEKCLSSVINQTLQNIEIVVVNDGSKDNTLDIIKKFAEKDKRIIIINQKNQGLGNTRNRAIEKARGKYIHLMDADDYMDSTFLENMVKNAEKYNSDLVLSTHRGIDEQTLNTLYVSTLPHTLIKSGFNLTNNIDILLVPCHVWDKIYLKKLIQNTTFTSEGGEDIYFWYRTALKAKNVSVHRKCEYNYRINTKSVQSNANYALGVFKNLRRAQELLKETKNPDIIGMFNIFKDVLIGHMLYRAHTLIEKDKKFRLEFYKNTKIFLDNKQLSSKLIKKKEWYWTDFALMDKIKKCKSFKQFEKIINIQTSSQLLFNIIKYKIKSMFVSKKRKEKCYFKMNDAISKLKFPIEYKLFGIKLFKLSHKGNKYTLNILGLPLFKRDVLDIYEKFYIIGVPCVSRNKIKTKVFGITIKNNIDAYLIRTFDFLGWKINDVYQGSFDYIGYQLNDVLPKRLDNIDNKLNELEK